MWPRPPGERGPRPGGMPGAVSVAPSVAGSQGVQSVWELATILGGLEEAPCPRRPDLLMG